MADSPRRFRRGRREQRRNIDWAKYTDFRSRHSVDDLAKLFAGYSRNELARIFNTPDKTGLCPIHWASIHNRSDLIEFLVDNGSRFRLKCRNKLFADGSSLHLAAMNGCIEAADALLSRYERSKQETTKPKTLYKEGETPPPSEDGPRIEGSRGSQLPQDGGDWLAERDAEGQTPLMRAAAPKSKRLDIVRDLLRKNLWSLSARPAEMALFLINKGANWRETDSKFSMNLMHLAIINDYDDIVNMLIVIDEQLVNVPAMVKQPRSQTTFNKLPPTPGSEPPKPKSSDQRDFVTIKLDTSGPSSASSDQSVDSAGQQSDVSSRPLIDRKGMAKNLLSSGLTPLQLAIIYGRLGIINLIWNANSSLKQAKKYRKKQKNSSRSSHAKQQDSLVGGSGKWNHSIETGEQTAVNNAELRRVLLRVVWSNKDELFSLVRGSLLKILLALDLTFLTLVWMPAYLMVAKDEDGGSRWAPSLKSVVFLASYCITLLLVFRVITRNPGYLVKNREKYFREMAGLVGHDRHNVSPANNNSSKAAGVVEEKESKQGEQQRDLLQLEDVIRQLDDKNGEKHKEKAILGSKDDKDKDNKPPNTLQEDDRQIANKSLPATGGDLGERVRLLCHRCRTTRKRRSRHCDHCNACVTEFDHHCIYLGQCIGRENRLDFLIMLAATTITAIYGSIIQANYLDGEQWKQFWHFLGFIWIFKYVLIGGFTVFFILRRASLGVTMYEEIRSNRIRRIFGPNGAPMNIMQSHRTYSTLKGSFWRYAPDRYLTGDLPYRKIVDNLMEFTNHTTIKDYFKSLNLMPDFSLARSMFINRDQKAANMYKYV